jgi:hypothetical protein
MPTSLSASRLHNLKNGTLPYRLNKPLPQFIVNIFKKNFKQTKMDEKQSKYSDCSRRVTYTQIQEALRVSPKVTQLSKRNFHRELHVMTTHPALPNRTSRYFLDDKRTDAPASPEPSQYITNPTHKPKKPKTMSYNHDN